LNSPLTIINFGTCLVLHHLYYEYYTLNHVARQRELCFTFEKNKINQIKTFFCTIKQVYLFHGCTLKYILPWVSKHHNLIHFINPIATQYQQKKATTPNALVTYPHPSNHSEHLSNHSEHLSKCKATLVVNCEMKIITFQHSFLNMFDSYKVCV